MRFALNIDHIATLEMQGEKHSPIRLLLHCLQNKPEWTELSFICVKTEGT